MKKLIFSSLLAVLMLNLCVSKTYAQDNKVYDHVSMKTPPTYPGGMQKFYQFFGSNIQYPKLAVENNIQGTLYLSFVIEKNGSIGDVKLDGRKLGYGTDEEAIRVVKLSQKWNPGMLAGKPVRVKYNIPVKFTMPNKKPNPDGTIYDHVSMENPPSYPGGMQKFYEFLGKNISYPKAASDNKVKGTVHVTFNIEKDGSLSDVKVVGNKIGSGIDDEAVRVVKLSQKWNPGLVNGVPARVKYNIPVKFTM